MTPNEQQKQQCECSCPSKPVRNMPQLAFLDKRSFKIILPAFWGQTKTESIPAMQWSTLPLTQRACWDRAAKPSPAAAGLQPVGPDLKSMASAYMCPGMHAMWHSLAKGMFIITRTCSLPAPINPVSPSRRFIVGVLNSRYLKVYEAHFSLQNSIWLHLRSAPPPICLSCAQVTEQARKPSVWICTQQHTHVQTPTEIIPAGRFLSFESNVCWKLNFKNRVLTSQTPLLD